jgi:hypothetical protein
MQRQSLLTKNKKLPANLAFQNPYVTFCFSFLLFFNLSANTSRGTGSRLLAGFQNLIETPKLGQHGSAVIFVQKQNSRLLAFSSSFLTRRWRQPQKSRQSREGETREVHESLGGDVGRWTKDTSTLCFNSQRCASNCENNLSVSAAS